MLLDRQLQEADKPHGECFFEQHGIFAEPMNSSTARHIFSAARSGRLSAAASSTPATLRRQLELGNDVAMGQTWTCANPAARHMPIRDSIRTSCSSTPKSCVAVIDAGIVACPAPGSENTATPVSSGRARSRARPSSCPAHDAARSGRSPCRTIPLVKAGARSRRPRVIGRREVRCRATRSISDEISTATDFGSAAAAGRSTSRRPRPRSMMRSSGAGCSSFVATAKSCSSSRLSSSVSVPRRRKGLLALPRAAARTGQIGLLRLLGIPWRRHCGVDYFCRERRDRILFAKDGTAANRGRSRSPRSPNVLTVAYTWPLPIKLTTASRTMPAIPSSTRGSCGGRRRPCR